jgi:hypothetical protein
MRTLFTCRLRLAAGARAPGDAVPPALASAGEGVRAPAASASAEHASATAKAAARELRSLSARVMM